MGSGSLVLGSVLALPLEVPILVSTALGTTDVMITTAVLRIVPVDVLVVVRTVVVPKITSWSLRWWLVGTIKILSFTGSSTSESTSTASQMNVVTLMSRSLALTEAIMTMGSSARS